MPLKSSARKKSKSRQPTGATSTSKFSSYGGAGAAADPDYVTRSKLLGDHYTQHGRYLDALKVSDMNISRD